MDQILEKRVFDVIQKYEDKDLFWFIKNSKIEALSQSGPQCGIVALCMALNSYDINCNVDNLMKRARELNYTKSGEIFDIEFLANLAKEYWPNLQITLLNSEKGDSQITNLILKNNLVLIAYDCDLNFEPCFKQGLKAHWALITGLVIPVDIDQSEFIREQDSETKLFYCQSSIEDHKLEILNNFANSNMDKIYAICRHGKSKHPGVWNLKKLLDSNKQLKLIDHQKCNDENFIKPEDDRMDYIQTAFNSWFGSNITYLANASGQTVRVIISAKRILIKEILTNGIKFDYDGVISKFNITNRNFHRLERSKQYEYMTIQKIDGEIICDNYEIGANKSYIILDNEIIRQKYGSNNLFEDRYGKSH